MDVREALYTTRAMRRLAPDPIPDDVLLRILDAAIRAPSAGNQHRFRFLVVRDPDTRKGLQGLYREAEAIRTGSATAPEARVSASAAHLADHLHEAPVLLFALARPGDESSVFPAVWSACLAARAEGVGSTVTTLLKARRAEAEALLGLPDDCEYRMAAMVPLGWPTGRWGIAERRPLQEMVYLERWGRAPGWAVDRPLWPDAGVNTSKGAR